MSGARQETVADIVAEMRIGDLCGARHIGETDVYQRLLGQLRRPH